MEFIDKIKFASKSVLWIFFKIQNSQLQKVVTIGPMLKESFGVT